MSWPRRPARSCGRWPASWVRTPRAPLAQVTHSTEPKAVSDKLRRLESYGDPTGRLHFFGPASTEAGSSSVEFVSIEHAFQSLREHGSAAQQEMLKRMLEWRTARS